MSVKTFLAVVGALFSMSAGAVVYTEDVPGELGPMQVEVVVSDGVFESLRVLGPSNVESLDEGAMPKGSETSVDGNYVFDPLSGGSDESEALIKAIQIGIAEAKKNGSETVIFEAGTYQACIRGEDGKKTNLFGEVCKNYTVDPLSGSLEAPEDLQKAVTAALLRAKRSR